VAEANFPENVNQFIYAHIDSIEQLEILLLLRHHADKSWSFKAISDELRSTPDSVATRILPLEKIGIIHREGDMFRYLPTDSVLKETIDDLEKIYRVRRQKIYELIFSPMKKRVRDFADAFIVNPKKGDPK
jgi:predicted transcriptional regulator